MTDYQIIMVILKVIGLVITLMLSFGTLIFLLTQKKK
ncbi:hypothetical protein EV213_110135 [Aureibacillus halotolerans]|uniref:Holin-like toxin n=1 Tax=Aureibacillus halotolerans TaxID=1508390 RepID=A0A4R6TWZ0_9BACI|nr:hypothetical protein EV213_110135 [Aureibacillus halotolerans]